MAFKLMQEEKRDLAEFRSKARAELDNLQDVARDLELAREKYLGAREKVVEAVTDIAGRFRAEFDEKSDTWKESDKGSETEDFISTWESVENDLTDLEDVPAFEDDDFNETLDNLPEQPE
jgi:hypothetical protein